MLASQTNNDVSEQLHSLLAVVLLSQAGDVYSVMIGTALTKQDGMCTTYLVRLGDV